MPTWLEALQAVGLLALTVQVWRLTREIRRLGRPGSPRLARPAPERRKESGHPSPEAPTPSGSRPDAGARPASGGRPSPPAPPAGTFATLVTGYLELLSRTSGAVGPPSADGASTGRNAPAPNGGPTAAGVGSRPGQATAPAGAHGGLHPETVRVVELLRQGLGPDEIARRLGMACGEVQVLERLARARGLL